MSIYFWNLKIGCDQILVVSLPTRNEPLAIAAKNYRKTDQVFLVLPNFAKLFNLASRIVVITRFHLKHNEYFTRFSYFTPLFQAFSAENDLIWHKRKTFVVFYEANMWSLTYLWHKNMFHLPKKTFAPIQLYNLTGLAQWDRIEHTWKVTLIC